MGDDEVRMSGTSAAEKRRKTNVSAARLFILGFFCARDAERETYLVFAFQTADSVSAVI